MIKKKVYIWGSGKYGRKAIHSINTENCEIEGIIDNDANKHGSLFEGIKIMPFRDIGEDYDLIIISVSNYDEVLYQLKLENYQDFSKIIVFMDESYCNNSKYFSILNHQGWRIALLENKVEKLEQHVRVRFDNIGYEIIDKYEGGYQYPKLGTTEEAIDKIVNEGCSLVRYGDGEFEIMAGKERPIFQNYDPVLAKRLKEIILSRDEKLLICIAGNYGNLDRYIEQCADGIRCYMSEEVRGYHMSVLDKDKVYYDTRMFKTYFPYKNRENTGERVAKIKKIWEGRDIVIVEGDKTRTGYGNDLFDHVKSLRRILCPTQNVFKQYEHVLQAVSNIEKDCLILAALGPVAELLVYDLMKKGYQAVDIGQMDMDYEWYLAGVKKRVHLQDKYVPLFPPIEISEVNDEVYLNQIITRIN